MPRLFTLCAFLLMGFIASAQLVPVTYRGAFAPAPTPMWTDGWAEWNPNAVNYPAPTVVVSGHISANTTWTANNVYELSGPVSVDTLISLTIEPGTIIRGDNNVPNSCLIIRRGAKLFAVGTACKPIVFTSDKATGNRAPGDWGGVVLLGRGVTNTTSGVAFIEGLNNIPESQYGGGASPDVADNSGILSYVRIEYGGYVFQPNVEINGLTMGAVGSGTQIDHIQCSFTNDDSYEWFGGSVNCSHLVAYRGVDDNWDTDNGFSGKVQFCLGVRDPDLYDPTYSLPSGGSSSEGFESDNDAGASNNNPRTGAIFSNVTDIGPFRGTSNPASDIFGFRRAARLRRNTELKIYNSILMDWRTGLFIDGSGAEANAVSGTLRFRNNIIAGAATNRNILRSSAAGSYAGIANIDSVATTDNILIRPYQFLTPDYRPTSTSLALTNYDFSDQLLPVRLLSFTGTTIKYQNVLLWQTGSEIDNKGFEIQRSVDGNKFSPIAFVGTKAANGNSSGSLSYSFTDEKPFEGKTYYRLKQVDKNGRSINSNVVVLRVSKTAGLSFSSVYPNPTKSDINLVFVSQKQQEVILQVHDVTGKLLQQTKITLNTGNNNYPMSVRSIAAGSYLITVKPADGSEGMVQKFVKD